MGGVGGRCQPTAASKSPLPGASWPTSWPQRSSASPSTVEDAPCVALPAPHLPHWQVPRWRLDAGSCYWQLPRWRLALATARPNPPICPHKCRARLVLDMSPSRVQVEHKSSTSQAQVRRKSSTCQAQTEHKPSNCGGTIARRALDLCLICARLELDLCSTCARQVLYKRSTCMLVRCVVVSYLGFMQIDENWFTDTLLNGFFSWIYVNR